MTSRPFQAGHELNKTGNSAHPATDQGGTLSGPEENNQKLWLLPLIYSAREMPRYVALLRGINVGGRNKVPMADLRRVAASLGHTEVATYIQRGNVVFTSPDR